jgi:hypothetical protein
MRNIKDQYLEITTLAKIWEPLYKKIDWKLIMIKFRARFIKKSKGFPEILAFSGISWNCLCVWKIMDRVYRSRDHGWISMHGGLVIMERCGRSGSREVVVIAWREREEVVRVLTNGVT